jgi:PAS domain S-box-containing protein
MLESQLLRQIEAISSEIAAGESRENVFMRISGAVHGLGFGRVRLDLLSPDGKTLSRVAARGFDPASQVDSVPADSDPDLKALRAHPVPQVISSPVPHGCVPILLQGKVIGKVTVAEPVAGSSLDADRLGGVMPLAHLASLTQAVFWAGSLEALQETTRAIISVRDRHALLTTIVEQSVKLLGAKSGGLYEYRPATDDLTVIADFNRPEHLNKTLKRGEGIAGRLLGSGETSRWTRDYSICEDRAETYPESTFGAVLVVLLKWDDQEIGALYVDDAAGREFSEMDIRLLQLFADQAAICLAQSDQVEKDQHKLDRLELLAKVTQKMVGDLDAMSWRKRLETIAEYATGVLEAETSGVFRARGNQLVLEASVGHQGDFEPGAIRLKIHNEPKGGLTGWIAHSGKLFNEHGQALKEHPAYAGEQPSHTKDCFSLLAIPLKRQVGGNVELVGLLRADNKKGPDGKPHAEVWFTPEDEEILTIFADAAVIAIESAELVDRLKEQRDSQERLIASSPDGIIAVDRRGRVTDFNKLSQETLGYSLEEARGMWVGQLYYTPEVPFWIGQRLRDSQDGRIGGYETSVKSKSGEEIPILHSSTWLYNSQGERVGSVGYFEDLRQQRAMERRESLLVEAMKVLADAEDLEHGLQRLAEFIVAKLGRSFCGILLMTEEEDALTLQAESLLGRSDWRPRNQRLELSQWRGLSFGLRKGEPYELSRSDPRYPSELDKLAKILGFSQTIHSLLVVPLKMGDKVIGQLGLGDFKVTGTPAFKKEDVDLVSAVASQIASLIYRFGFGEATARREKLQKALVEASKHIRAEMELPALAQSIVRLAAELVDCRAGGLFLHQRHLGQLDRAAVYGVSEDLVPEYLYPQDGFLWKVAQGDDSGVHPNPVKDDVFLGLELESVAVVPCVSGAGDVEAVLFVGDSARRQPFSKMDIDILKSFATQATIALRTTGLIDQEARYLSQIAVLQRISRYVQETNRLDRILHAVLTGVTAHYGLGFNRAMLLLFDRSEAKLVGQLGIGEVEKNKAKEAWEWDEAHGLDDFESYLDRLESDRIEVSTVGRKLSGFVLPVGEGDFFSSVLTGKSFRKIDPEDVRRLASPLRDTFDITTDLAVAPLVGKGEAIGLLLADNKFTQAPISNKLADTLMAFAATAAVAIENRRIFELTQRTAERLSAFYQMSSELVALQDPQYILQRIVDQTVQVAGASWVSILLIDRSGWVIAPPVRSGPHVPESPLGPLHVRPTGITMKVMKEGHALFFENVEREQNAAIPPHPSLTERGAKAAICLPLALPGKRIGVMWIHYAEPRPFPKSEVAALQLYVNQAATAYDSARRLEKLEDLRAVFEDLAEAEDTKSVIQRLVVGAQRVLKADEVVFWAFEKTTNSFLPGDSDYRGKHETAWEDFQAKNPRLGGTAARVMAKEWLCEEDVQASTQSSAIGPNTREFLTAVGGRGFKGVALKVGKESLGVLYAIYSEPCQASEEERDTARSFANHAALALKKAKLLQQVQRSQNTADMVARVTLSGDPGHALVRIASEIRGALSCDIVSLFKYDEEAGELILPAAIVGATLPLDENADSPLVFAMLSNDGPKVVTETQRDDLFRESHFAQSQGVRSCVVFPLRAAGRKVGVLFLSYRYRHRFTAETIATMELFANQAAVAVHIEQLFRGLSTKLKQQEVLAGLSEELLGVSSAQETLDRAVEYAARCFHTEFCNIVLPDREGHLKFRASFGWSADLIKDLVLDPGIKSQTGYTIQEKRPVAVEDFSKVTEFEVPQIVFDMRIQSGLSAPMFRGGEVIGAMIVHTTRRHKFIEEDKLLMGLIANQTVLALERAEQYEKSQRKSKYLKALNEANKAITASFGLERSQLLEKIIKPTMEQLVGIEGPKAILGTIILYDEARKELILDSIFPPEKRASFVELHGERRSLEGRLGITGRAVTMGEPQIVPNVKEDEDYVAGDLDTMSELAVPLLDRDYNRVLGALNVESNQINAFDEEDIEALVTLAELAVIAFQNARRLEDLRTQTNLALIGMGNAVGHHELNTHIANIRADLTLLAKRLEEDRAPGELVAETLRRADERLKDLSIERPEGQADQRSSILVNDGLLVPYKNYFLERHPDWTSRLQLKLDLGPRAQVRGNVEWLFKVLDLLVHNAIRVSAKTIILGSRVGAASMAEIYVEDDGPGIPQEVRPYFLKQPVYSAKGSGTGALMAKNILRIYGGTLDWRDVGELSERTRTGTRMLLLLPLEAPYSENEILHTAYLVIDQNQGG